LVIDIRLLRKEQHQKPLENWWEIRKHSEFLLGLRSIFRGQVVSFRERMGWDTPWKINMERFGSESFR